MGQNWAGSPPVVQSSSQWAGIGPVALPMGRKWATGPYPITKSGSAELPVCRRELPSTSGVSMHSGDLPSTSVNITHCRETFRQLPVRPVDLLSISINISCGRVTFR